jgi:hypothetical protein
MLTGYEMYCSCSGDGYVDIEIYQVVMGISPGYPSVSLSLPLDAASSMATALFGIVELGHFLKD